MELGSEDAKTVIKYETDAVGQNVTEAEDAVYKEL